MKNLLLVALLFGVTAPSLYAMSDFEYDMREHFREVRATVAANKKAAQEAATAMRNKQAIDGNKLCKAEYIISAMGADQNQMQKRYWATSTNPCKDNDEYIITGTEIKEKNPEKIVQVIVEDVKKAAKEGYGIIAIDSSLPQDARIDAAMEAARKKGLKAMRVSSAPAETQNEKLPAIGRLR